MTVGAKPRGAAAERQRALPFEHVPAKVIVPAPRPGSISRTAIVNRLRAARGFPLVTIVAPPGSGKTTVLAQWAARDRRPFAWLSVDERDDDPVVLLRHLAAALHRVVPLERRVLCALEADGPSVWAAAVPRLAAAIASAGSPFVLVLDDASRLASPDSLELVSTLAAHVPEHSTLVLAGRAAPGLPIPSLRTGGGLFEVGPGLLALGRREAVGLLAATGVELADEQVRELVDQTEGWAAGLYLAALAVRDRAGTGDASVGIAGDDRYLADYFRLECLSALGPDRVAFLRRTSILDTLSGPICDAVLERSGSALELEALEAAGLFLVPLDRRRNAYRYHRLFRDFLRRELEQHEPGLVAPMHLRAADRYEADGAAEAAVAHAAAAGDLDRVARLVGSAGVPACDRGRADLVESWVRLFGRPELDRHPAVAAVAAWVHARAGRATDAERCLAVAERAADHGPLPDGSPTLRPWVATVRAAICADGVEQMLSDSRAALDELSAESYWRPTALLLHGTALALLGETGPADDALRRAVEAAETSGATDPLLAALSQRALLAAESGDPAAAHVLAEEAGRFDADDGILAAGGLRRAILARVLLRAGRAAEACGALDLACRVADSTLPAFPWLAAQTRVELGRAFVALRDTASARTQLAAASRILACHPGLGVASEQVGRLEREIGELEGARHRGESALSPAELRLLPLLTSHLSFREIAEQFSVTRNTIKSQAISIYRKLGASSRSEAIAAAARLGLIETATPGRDLTPASRAA